MSSPGIWRNLEDWGTRVEGATKGLQSDRDLPPSNGAHQPSHLNPANIWMTRKSGKPSKSSRPYHSSYISRNQYLFICYTGISLCKMFQAVLKSIKKVSSPKSCCLEINKKTFKNNQLSHVPKNPGSLTFHEILVV